MLSKLYYILFKSYHRPSAKLFHFYIFLKAMLYNNNTKLYSERQMLLKQPPESIIFYNTFGRFVSLILNTLSIIFLNKYFDSNTFIDDKKIKNEIKKNGNNFSAWPTQAMHEFEKLRELDEESYSNIEKNYQLSINSLEKKTLFKDSPWWIECRKEFKSIFIKSNNTIDAEEFKNFRNNKNTKAALLADQNFLSGNIESRFTKLKSLSLINLYHKISELIDVNILRTASESYSGNTICLNYRGQRLSHRVLRYAYYTSQIYKNVRLNKYEKNTILDLGGGYGGLGRFLKNSFDKTSIVIIEIPEVCAFATYFLKNIFPNKKIATFKDFTDLNLINRSKINNYDFIILPQTMIEKLEDNSIDLSINTTSLGEMTNEMQNFYIDQIERITKTYFYSVNRADTRKDKYNAQGFYNLNFKHRWKSLIYKFTHTYHIEFLGEKKND